eukprot:TRINITY_DN28145_c0_g1_i1.p1 TRINITY_DN28145_c0_g1~~TRINITY_DN28145_c0_g1_i1.p1  ORF type:complete len:274 (+),score=31.76 TRINITY_DN28145_c0_g1_i1:89-910(+)
MVSDVVTKTLLSDGWTNVTNGTAIKPVEIHDQCPSGAVLCLIVISVLYLIQSSRWKLRDALGVIVCGYVLADVYMAVLHMFLDHPRTRENPVNFVKELALDFQKHHSRPITVVGSNHVSSIDLLNTATLGLPLFWVCLSKLFPGRSLSPHIVLFALATACGGIIAAYNHVCCHARTHEIPIPWVIELAQDVGLLPDNQFHRKHHTPPHDVNFSFLVGGAPLYDFLNLKLQALVKNYYEVMAVLFCILQPFVVSSGFAICFLLKCESPGKQKTA